MYIKLKGSSKRPQCSDIMQYQPIRVPTSYMASTTVKVDERKSSLYGSRRGHIGRSLRDAV